MNNTRVQLRSAPKNGAFGVAALLVVLIAGRLGAAQENTWAQNFELGKKLFSQGRFVEADRHMTQALEQVEASGGRDVRLFQTLNRLSLIRHELGRLEEAVALGKRALSAAEAVGRELDVGYCLNNLGMFLWSQGKTAEAEPYLKRALETLQRVGNNDQEAGLAKTTNNVGNLYYNKGRWKEAGEYWRRALALHEERQMSDPVACNTLGNLAQWHWARGERDKSWEYFRRALDHAEKRLGKKHPIYGVLVNYTGANRLEEGKLDEAETALKQALAIFEQAKLTADNPVLADCLRNWGELHRLRKNHAEAERNFQASLAGWKKSVLKVPREAKTHFKLGMLYLDQERWQPAEASFKEALDVYDKAIGAPHPDIADVLDQYAVVLMSTGRAAEAGKMQARAKAMRAEHARANDLK
jgi:tetratricopeptide (TPR) repeat protein